MFCGACGTPNPESNRYCVKCGGDLASQRTPTPLSPAVDDPATTGGATGPVVSLTGAQPTGPAWAPAVEVLAPGAVIEDRYEIESLLGQGGMAVVYRARDRKLDRPVALKIISARLGATRDGIARFEQEARAVASLNHANIVSVYDVGESPHGRFFAMELLEGGTLSALIQHKGASDPEEALPIVKGIAQALAHAHRKAVIHRDLKPSNVLLTREGVPKVADFGLARMMGSSDLSRTGQGLGTPYYMAPEQARDAKNVDYRADVYSLGATAYHLLTGDPPATPRESRLPERWRHPVMKAMEPNRENRHFTVEEFLEEFEGAKPVVRRPKGEKMPEGECPQCGFENPKDSRYCEECGAGLFENCPKCKREMRAGTKHCAGCGVNIPLWREVQECLARAKSHREAGSLGRAEKEYKRALELEPRNEEARQGLSEVKELQEEIDALLAEASAVEMDAEREDYESAERLYRQAVQLNPKDERATRALQELPGKIRARDARRAIAEAAQHLAKRDLDAAAEAIARAEGLGGPAEEIERSRSAVRSLRAKAEEAYARGRAAGLERERDASSATSRDSSPEPWPRLEEARQALERALDQWPAHPEARKGLDEVVHRIEEAAALECAAEAAHREGDYEKAAEEARRALEVNPELQTAGEIAAKSETALAEIRRFTDEAMQLESAAQAAHGQGDFEEAKSVWEQLAALPPQYASATPPPHAWRALIEMALRATEAAQRAGLRAKEVADLLVNTNLESARRDWRAVVETCRKIATLRREHPEEAALRKQAVASMAGADTEAARAADVLRGKNFEAARAAAHAVLEADPGNERAKVVKSEVETALKTIEEHRRMGDARLNERRYAEAIEAFGNALALRPDPALAARLEEARRGQSRSRRRKALAATAVLALLAAAWGLQVASANRSGMQAAREHIAGRRFEEAQAALKGVGTFTVDPAEKARLGAQAQVGLGIEAAETLASQEDWSGAFSALKEARARCGTEPDFGPFLAEIEEGCKAAKALALGKVEAHRKAREFAAGAALLAQLQEALGGNPDLEKARTEFRQDAFKTLCGVAQERIRDGPSKVEPALWDKAVGDYQQARPFADNPVRVDEWITEARAGRVVSEGYVALAKGDPDRAERSIKEAEAICPVRADVGSLRKAVAGVREAQRLAAEEADRERRYADAMKRVKSCVEAKDWSGAAEAVTEALNVKPGDEAALRAKEEAERDGRFWTLVASASALQGACSLDRALSNLEAHISAPLGKEGQSDETTRPLQRWRRCEERLRQATTLLEEALRTKEGDRAALDLRKMIDADLRYYNAMENATVCMEERDWISASKAVETALSERPSDEDATNLRKSVAEGERVGRYNDAMSRGEEFRKSGDWANAKVAAEEALGVKPGDATALALKEEAAEREKRYGDAMTRAEGYRKSGDWEKAKACAAEALGAKPGDAAATALRDSAAGALKEAAEIEEKKWRGTVTIWLDSAKTVKMELVRIKVGKFMMGSNAGDDDEKPMHEVTLTQDYWMQTTEVTQKQWTAVMGVPVVPAHGDSPSEWKGDDLPVEKVSWEDCQKFMERLNEMVKDQTGGRQFGLPTEAQWEYACRAGTDTEFYWGDDPPDKYMWYADNSGGKTHPVGQKKPNEFGCYDMSGNVWEWCQDWYDKQYYARSPHEDPPGVAGGLFIGHVLRGGSWDCTPEGCCSSNRAEDKNLWDHGTSYPSWGAGFRCVATLK
ncbi:MAG: SUMF1/EgtB/PvdO family nonheme iron enzyme [Planctomycetes bacterium]|nr:SUMF1/EgtB/PvdO family nonheme iron enzyme [Planctomycetota bacterium]